MWTNKNISFGLLLANLVGFFSWTMFAGSPQRRVRQRTDGELALKAKIMNRSIIAERNVVRADIMVAPLDSIHDITGATSTIVPVSSSLDWSTCFMQILRSYTMMTVGWFFSPLWMVISLQLILISSARSLGYPCFSSRPACTMRWSCLYLWMISESSFRLCLRVRSVPPPSGLVPYLPHIACLPRFFSTISGPFWGTVT
jgi:hypothetical protein